MAMLTIGSNGDDFQSPLTVNLWKIAVFEFQFSPGNTLQMHKRAF